VATDGRRATTTAEMITPTVIPANKDHHRGSPSGRVFRDVTTTRFDQTPS